jgi:hypothetical protein
MFSQSGIKAVGAILALGVMLGACSEIYLDRRETVSLGAGDALAVDEVTHMIDPWPRYSANHRIAFNGERVQAAQDRYRHGKVITPVLPTTVSKDYQTAQQQAASTQAATSQSTSATPAAPVKGPGGTP